MNPTRRLTLSRATFSGFVVSMLALPAAQAAPKGAQVERGSANVLQNGVMTTIRAGNGAVINYSSFDVAKGERVDFIQPNSSSRVLNRVNSADPTRIFGQLNANGQVYLVNPSGIYFENGSMINVGHLYAAAGRLSTTDFTAGKNTFSDVQGSLVNAGSLSAAGSVHLFGGNVANIGTITAKTGMVVLKSGNDVLVGQRDSNIYVRGNAPATSTNSAASPAGTSTPARPIMGAGDLLAVAISNTGIIKSKQIVLSGGPAGTVNVSGTLDASSAAANGRGGSIQITGQTVALQGATLNASGTRGGGTVQVGGGFQGKGGVMTAQKTTVDAATSIKADALVNGKGGNVVVWSDQATTHAGTISAKGAGLGAGGQAEVSSKGQLAYSGTTILTAASGKTGTLLLDPSDLTITSGGGGEHDFAHNSHGFPAHGGRDAAGDA